MAEGVGTLNPGGFLQHIKVWAGGGLSLAGLCTPARAWSCSALWVPGLPPCWNPPSITRMCDVEQETHVAIFFFSMQQLLPLIPGCPGSPCALLAMGALSVQGNNPLPSWVPLPRGQDQGFGMGWAQVPILRGCWGGEGSTGPETHNTDPRSGWWLFFSHLLSLTRSSSGGQGELSSTTPHLGKRYEKYKNKEAYI